MIRTAHLAVLVLLTLGVACDRGVESPPRPANVPAEAYWLGGPDGGVFVKLARTSDSKAVAAEVYSEGTGESLYRGLLRMEPPGQPLERLDDPKIFTAWDGEKLHLADGRTLQAEDGPVVGTE